MTDAGPTPEGDAPDARPDADAQAERSAPASRRPWYLWAGLGVAVVLVVVVIALVARPSDPTYDDASRDRFLEACTADAGEPVRSTCECLYDRIQASVPYDRFELISDDLRREAEGMPPDAPLELPDDVQAMLDACLEEQAAN
jgi:hypothetical protein